ncbi:leucine-rich repeat domain-containing protein [Microseira sp. BLCC-F43]|uniref:leucine-rich repeat domain-containing protein n=1 Tax=Microseira sp. BLCC-F43 TaxID=3153602 RepID=UPI0035BAF04C
MSEQKPNHNPTFSSFADWCKNKDSLSKEARKTVEALLKDARTSDCNEAERILSSCTELSVYSYRDISDLSPLSTLTNLNKLWISDNQISDLSPLSTLTNLTKLKSGSNQISELSPLSGLTNLTQLGISNNQISDLSPLSTLTNLTELNLYVNQISDLRPLSGLTNLTQLILGHNRISDLSPLSTLTNLTWLCICDNPVTDLSPLSTLINLTSLDIGEDKYDPFGYDFSGQISNLSPLSTLTNLTELNLNDNQISDIRPLSNLTNLTKLHLADNQISEIGPLSTLTNLTKLNLGPNPISDLSIARSHEEKWHTLSQKPIDPQKAKEAIKSAYAVIGKAEPEMIFCSSPYAGIPLLQACENLGEPLADELSQSTSKLLNPELWDSLSRLTVFQPGEDIKQQLDQQLEDDGFDVYGYITPEDPLCTIALTEYCVSKLGCVLDRETQEAFYCLNQLFEHCGWIWAYEKVCIVCDRPTQLFFDNEYRLHAEGQPAIQFSDGYSLYSYHGVTLPEKSGKLHPNYWQSEWILSEENAELRRVLIQAIGYARICQELAAQELDNWREYTLLKIDNDLDVAPVYLLKMTCPSTGHIHALRVPPDMQSAREAIRWVNWGIDPEEFSVQT